jgi:hypothetical protein
LRLGNPYAQVREIGETWRVELWRSGMLPH